VVQAQPIHNWTWRSNLASPISLACRIVLARFPFLHARPYSTHPAFAKRNLHHNTGSLYRFIHRQSRFAPAGKRHFLLFIMIVSIQRIDPTLPLPKYESAGAVAFDLVTRETTVIQPGKIGLVPGNVIVKVPEGHALILVSRSSLPRKKGLVFPHSIGVVDCDYHGEKDEVMVQVQNITDASVTVERGERIAQGLFVKVDRAEWSEVDSHGAETRGGFGSTGTH
jgi:dUTP pyrophosphatase